MIITPEIIKKHGLTKDEYDKIHDFLEFDTVYHLIDTIEAQYKSHDLKNHVLRERDGDDDFHYSGNSKWTYGTTFKNRIATRDALLNSEVPELMWKVIDKLRDSLLAMEEVQRLIDLAPSIKKQRKFGMSGDELCIDRILVKTGGKCDQKVAKMHKMYRYYSVLQT